MDDTESTSKMEIEETNNSTGLNDLPDEILENIFSRISHYDDLENVKITCKRWNTIAKNVITSIQNNFDQALKDGTLQCEIRRPTINEHGRIVGSWIIERFGHMCCYYDKIMYVVGGTTHTPTTFNDMWRFHLDTRQWSRCIGAGQYPSPKALGTLVSYTDKLVLFGGWSHPSPYPIMQPWRIFDELHIFDVPTSRWSHIISTNSPPPSAGHSASVHGDKMVIFGGRTFNQQEQSYPISNSTWVFDFEVSEWFPMLTNEGPQVRYGQTQISIDDKHLLIIGGCGGPNQIFSDVWLLKMTASGPGDYIGEWKRIIVDSSSGPIPNDFHYSGCKVGNNVVFCERSSPVSPFLAFLHFDSTACLPPDHNNLVFEAASRNQGAFHGRCSSGLRQPGSATGVMPIYSLDISEVVSAGTVKWCKEPESLSRLRPNERLLYSMVAGRGELVLFGGFYKQPNGTRCRVSNDVFILKTAHKSY